MRIDTIRFTKILTVVLCLRKCSLAESDQSCLDVYVVIPAFNEAPVIDHVIKGLEPHVSAPHVIVVDDCSTDQSGSIAASTGACVIRHLINRGQGAALATGIQVALRRGAKAIVTFDADGQHDPDDVPAMVEPVLSGEVDVVLGTRFKRGTATGMPRMRRLVLKTAVLFTRALTGLRITDVHNGFRVLSAEAARTIRIRQDRMEHASEILDEIKFHRIRFLERPTRVRYSAYSLNKGQKNLEALRLALRILFYKVGG